MLRLLAVIAATGSVGAAFFLYAVKYDTRRLEAQVQIDERTIEKLEGDIAMLKAERAYLARPERIEQLARRQGLSAIRQSQYVRVPGLVDSSDEITSALGARSQ